MENVLRAALLDLARNRALRSFCESSLGMHFASRFVAGREPSDLLRVTRQLARKDIGVAADHLGENVTTAEEASAAAAECITLLGDLATSSLDVYVSVKLTQFGLDLGSSIAENHLQSIAQAAKATGRFVRVDMESSAYTDRTLAIVREVAAECQNVGTVIQACLHRSANDLAELLRYNIPVRLVKGAYQEPAEIAFQDKRDVDQNYRALVEQAAQSGIGMAVATHDEKMIAFTKEIIMRRTASPGQLEFQMLYGIRPDLQRMLVKEGYRVRVYVPYGQAWYPYLMRRLAERPANLVFLLKNVLRFNQPEDNAPAPS